MKVAGQWLGSAVRGAQWQAWAVLVLAVVVTVVAWQATQDSVESDARVRFEAEAARVTPRIERRLSAYEQVLRGGVSLFDTWGRVSRGQWRTYVTGLQVDRNFPGIQGIGFAEIVPAERLANHLARIRGEGFPDYAIHPEGDRPVYSAIIYLEPFDWRNQRAFGFDMLAEPVRRAAMERARDTGEPAMSGKVRLVQETETDTQPGVLIYLPVYSTASVPASLEARRSELRGYVYAPFRMGDLMAAVIGQDASEIRIEVFDGEAPDPAALLFDSAPEEGDAASEPPMFQYVAALDVLGQRWTLRAGALPGFAAFVDSEKPLIVLVAGAIASVLLFWAVWTLGRGAERSRRQEADFRYLFEKNPNILWVYDRKTLKYLAVNEAAVRRYGYSADEFLGMRVTDIRPPEEVPRLLEVLSQPHTGLRHAGEWTHRTKSGEILIVDISSYPITFRGHEATLSSAINVTDKVRAEAAQRTSEALRAAVLESALDAVIVIDEEGKVLEFNPAAERTFGHARDDMIGRELADVILPQRYRDEHRNGLARFRQSGISTILGRRIELAAVRADGSEFPVEIAISAARIDGRTIFTGYLRDVTELRSAQAELQQAQKMEAIGRLTGGVAHDFNNLLTVVLGNAELLAESPSLDASQRADAAQIVTVAERAADLTRQLLAFARRQPLQPQQIDLNRLVGGMEGLLRRTLGEDVDIQIAAGEGLWLTMADPAQLQSALLNIAINGRDAMPEGGKLSIETGNAHLDAEYAAHNAEVRPGDYVTLAVTDTGFGMAPEVLERAFEPFFTTKDVGKGSGLGLSMTYGFVKQSGGHVKIYSEVGQGTSVRIYLPRSAAEAEPALRRPKDGQMPVGSETILVVEDDAAVRAHVQAQLDALGYTVLTAAHGPAGLAVLEGPAEIDLLFTDIVMPGGMNGQELAEHARRLRPGLPVLFTSGYPESALVHDGRLDAGVQLLNKPYRRRDLAEKIRQVLDGH
jgi:PAS domain S-box-containing protein